MSTLDKIRAHLAPLNPAMLELEDQSHLHAGHAGAAGGGGHFQLTIVSDHFTGQSPLARHRVIFAALDDLMKRDIHALSITALTPDEASSARGTPKP